MRQIVLDTETTGLVPSQGHRIIEIGCVELIDRRPTRNDFHCYLNPEREIDAGAEAVHGLSQKFLSSKPLFIDVVDEFLKYIGDAELVIHNAPFDLGFLNHELAMLKPSRDALEITCSILDTLPMARKLHPGQRNSLDALCKRYTVDNSKRDLHGALLDAQLLADVYLAMTGGQETLFGNEAAANSDNDDSHFEIDANLNLVVKVASADECANHEQFLDKLAAKSGKDIWRQV